MTVTNTDNDAVGHHRHADRRLTTTEAGGTATFTVRADSAADGQRDDRLTRATRRKARSRRRALTFTTANWNVAQTVTVTGVDDSLDDGDVAYTILTAPATSADADLQQRRRGRRRR